MYRVFRSRLLHIFLLLVLVNQVSPMNIKIGALYSKNSERLFKLLEYLLAHEPRELTLKKTFILQLVPLNVDGEDLLSQDVARKLSSVYAVIDLDCKNENVLALSSLLQRPLVKVDNIDEETPHKYALSVRPSYRDVCDALFDMIKFYSFTKVAVVYDARKARQASLFFATVRKWPRYNAEMMPELPLNNQYKVREALTALLKAHIKQVVLFADQKDLATIMNEALFVGINDKDLKWIASDLEVAGPNKTYPSIRGLVGLSLHLSNTTAAKRLENISKNKVTVPRGANNYSSEMYSAVHDAASVVVKGLNIFLSNKTRVDMAIEFSPNQKCPLRSKKDSMAQAILDDFKKVSFKGFTGTVAFKRTGERKITTGMDILNILRKEVKKIGSWKPELGNKKHNVLPGSSEEPKWIGCFYESVKCHNHNPDLETIGLSPKLPKLNITTVLEPPFVEKVNKSSKLVDLAGKVSKGDLQGFLIDVIDELSKEAQFDYDIYLRPDRKYAKMIEELKNQEKDMALAPITITAQREQDIDFSKPFMDFSLSLIMQKANEPAINNFAFLQPFTGQVWLSTIGVVLFITGMMCVMDYLSPFGYRARALESDEEPGNEFNLLNSLWFATASVLQQGPDSTPLAPSGRLLASTFWFFILILISTYTANLAAFFTIKRTADTINSLEALANQNEIKYGVMNGGSVMTFFENSEDSLYRKMFSHMREYQTFVDGTKAGVEKARTEQYAYITEYPYLEYYNQQKPCNTRLLKNLIQTKSYGIGLQRNSPYTNRITVGILNLRERNFIERKRRRWWDDRSQCPPPSKSKTGNTQSLDVNNLAGVFIILLGGVVISIVLVIIEIRCRKLVDLLTNGKCRKAEEEADGGEVIPTENIRFVEPRVTAPYMINLRPHYDKYAFAPESKL